MSCSIKQLCQDSQDSVQTIDPVLSIESNCVNFFKEVLQNDIRLKGVINKEKILEEPDFSKVKSDPLTTIFFDIIPVDDIPMKVYLNFNFNNFFIVTKKGVLCILNKTGEKYIDNPAYIDINKKTLSAHNKNIQIKYKTF
jgi:hypothetical protein